MDRNALIADFVKQWGYPDPVVNDEFQLDLNTLISKICPEPTTTLEPSIPLPKKPTRGYQI